LSRFSLSIRRWASCSRIFLWYCIWLIAVTALKRCCNPETLEAVEGYTLLRTDQNGWIELSTDGEQMWVEVEKK